MHCFWQLGYLGDFSKLNFRIDSEIVRGDEQAMGQDYKETWTIKERN